MKCTYLKFIISFYVTVHLQYELLIYQLIYQFHD